MSRTGATASQAGFFSRLGMAMKLHRQNFSGSLRGLFGQPTSSLMTITVLAISLALPATFHVLLKNGKAVSQGWNQGVEIALFLRPEISDSRAEALTRTLQLRSEVAATRLVSKEDALQEFKSRSGFGDAMDFLDENPLPAMILVTPTRAHSSPDSARALIATLAKEREVDVAQLDLEWVRRFQALLQLGDKLALALGLILAGGVVLIIGNTIRLAILNRRPEIEIVKLVGATDAFIRRPFLYTGFWYGALAGLVCWLLVTLLVFWLGGPVSRLAGLYQSSFRLDGLAMVESLWLVGAAILLGLLGAWISVSRHLKAIQPQ